MMNKEVTYALNYALNKGFQIHPDAFKILENIQVDDLERIIKEIVREKSKQNLFLISQDDLENFLGIKQDESIQNEHRILSDPTLKITSAQGIDGFNSLFASRYSKLKRIISNRPEAKLLRTISSVKAQNQKNDVYVCGLLSERKSERNVTKLVVDDPSGTLEGIVFDRDLQDVANSLLNDQFFMMKIGFGKNGGFIVKDIIMPDIPDHVGNRSETEAYAVFLSDLHIGSKYFMEDELTEFFSWLSSPDPIARKVRFVLISGDLVDGVGIFPNQDKELDFKNIEEQLVKSEEILSKIPNHIKVFIIPGNHDPGRRALPQAAIPKKYCESIWERENFFMLGNPSLISLNGVKVLLFHGQSIDDIVKTAPGLSYNKPAKVMQYLLRARHLSPIYGSSTPIAPETEDMMTIDEIPDIFHVGHVHVLDLDLYRRVLLINSGTWQKQTPFQTSVGITPTPGIAVIVNLKTFKVFTKNINFDD